MIERESCHLQNAKNFHSQFGAVELRPFPYCRRSHSPGGPAVFPSIKRPAVFPFGLSLLRGICTSFINGGYPFLVRENNMAVFTMVYSKQIKSISGHCYMRNICGFKGNSKGVWNITFRTPFVYKLRRLYQVSFRLK